MFASRASRDRSIAPRASLKHFSLGATLLHEYWLARDARWVLALSLFYALTVVAATLALNPYLSQTWDVVTFVKAARTFLEGSWQSLYAQSRAAQTWPYAYPPLHALLVAPFLNLPFPDYLTARVPPLLADVGVGWLLYAIVARKTEDKRLSRHALAVWLLNPITFYDTAVQGHFEAEWLFFVLVAYHFAESRRSILTPTPAFAVAFLFKQTAVLFALPYWATLLFRSRDPLRARIARAVASAGIGSLIVLGFSLPFLLYSRDYLYMIAQYVASVPLQTQSWLVAVSSIFSPDFFVLEYSSILILIAALLISIFAIRRGASLYLTALFVTLVFFLLSKKVVGYYYVMLLPFALIEFLSAQRFRLLMLIVAATAWMSLSPYLASWANQDHWPVYAALGALNSLLWVAIFVHLWRDLPVPLLVRQREMSGTSLDKGGQERVVLPFVLAFFSVTLFLEAVGASLLQPLVNSQTSPIRAPLIPDGLEANALLSFFALLSITLILCAAFYFLPRPLRVLSLDSLASPPFLLPFAFVPLYFLTFTLTKESTAMLELALKSIGL